MIASDGSYSKAQSIENRDTVDGIMNKAHDMIAYDDKIEESIEESQIKVSYEDQREKMRASARASMISNRGKPGIISKKKAEAADNQACCSIFCGGKVDQSGKK